MIVGLGTDLVRVSRIEELYEKHPERFLDRILTIQERSKFDTMNKIQGLKFLAKRFAAKEAFVKSIGTGFNEHVHLKDIAISNDKKGKPYYEIPEKLHQYIQKTLGITKYSINLSITDDREYANAIAIIEKIS